jgi:hypothetical protein
MAGMARGLRRTSIAIAVAVAAFIVVPAVSARLNNELTITMAKHEDGPYSGMNPVVTVRHVARSLYFRATSFNTVSESVTLTDGSVVDPGHRHDYRIRWYKGKHDITTDTRGSGYDFNLRAGASKVFRAYVKPRVGNPGRLCLTALFHETAPHVQDRAGGFYVNSDSICG